MTNTLPIALILIGAAAMAGPPKHAEWELIFQDEFDGTDPDLDKNWAFQNWPSGHILCSRWRENAVLQDGILRLVGKKETRAGQDWTAASLWTKRKFRYGYFECRYRYLPATGTNNSFWIMTRDRQAPRFEIDINEGHYPDEVNMNLHNHSGKHWAKGGRWYANPRARGDAEQAAGFEFQLAQPIRTSKIRLVSEDHMVRIVELRAYAPSTQGYPSVFPEKLVAQPKVENLALKATATADSVLRPEFAAQNAIDGKVSNDSRWVSGKAGDRHELIVDFRKPRDMGCVQFISGWLNKDEWQGIVEEFAIEFWDGAAWKPVPGANRDALRPDIEEGIDVNLGKSFHVYGLEWDENELVYYFDGKPVRRQAHDICRREAPVWLSLAIMKWAGRVTDAIDGKSMDVDYVRVYRKK